MAALVRELINAAAAAAAAAHQRYCKNISRSYNKATASFLIQKDIMISYNDRQYGRILSRPITRNPSQDFNDGLSNPRPDILEGIETEALPSHLHDHSLHLETGSLTFCHFAAEFERAGSNLRLATSKAAYDGAVLVNARNQAIAKAKANTLDGTAAAAALDKAAEETSVVTCITDGKVAEVYIHHYKDGQYHMNLIARESLLSYPNRGRDIIRNTQDYARRKSYELARLLGADLKEKGEEEKEQGEEKEEKEVVEAKGWGSFWPFQ
ncbi:hypothetical protein B0T24DRAFT_534473 [Lasiosphaeria ovina]|uniref:Uncharacterized protein n=1 Tax=Lasiosphaeria ovina TaxID=92902 RepID=A0AAE0JYB5_9PEZI|nr:hypothetical protein B0T24DRAFT_534473 [Lasiosphaeria ovina]